MARFVNTATNGRGNEVMIGGRGSAGSTHLRGWDVGVKVVPIGVKGERDRFEIYVTGGSHAASMDKLIGEVRGTPDGPLFLTRDQMEGE
jgi:hypothetical protein